MIIIQGSNNYQIRNTMIVRYLNPDNVGAVNLCAGSFWDINRTGTTRTRYLWTFVAFGCEWIKDFD